MQSQNKASTQNLIINQKLRLHFNPVLFFVSGHVLVHLSGEISIFFYHFFLKTCYHLKKN